MKIVLPLVLVAFITACAPVTSRNTTTTSPTTVPAAQTLSAYHWQLESATDADGHAIDTLRVPKREPLQLDFQDGRLAVSNTCNRMGGSYAIKGDTLVLSHLMSTRMACPGPRLNALDRKVGEVLSQPLTIGLLQNGDERQLVLTSARGETLTFDAIPTAATRYGSKGTVEFLEVAPQTATCATRGSCLKVRQIHFDERGIRTGNPGPWHALVQPIEGYTHKPGMHDVLRVTRYNVTKPAADASSVAYVLDLVVQSGPAD